MCCFFCCFYELWLTENLCPLHVLCLLGTAPGYKIKLDHKFKKKKSEMYNYNIYSKFDVIHRWILSSVLEDVLIPLRWCGQSIFFHVTSLSSPGNATSYCKMFGPDCSIAVPLCLITISCCHHHTMDSALISPVLYYFMPTANYGSPRWKF